MSDHYCQRAYEWCTSLIHRQKKAENNHQQHTELHSTLDNDLTDHSSVNFHLYLAVQQGDQEGGANWKYYFTVLV